jgi:ribosomal protein S18 acetylase RimI-like enzyme
VTEAEVKTLSNPVIRAARPQDVDAAAGLVVRLKGLNGEFDPMFTVSEGSLETAKKYLHEAITSQNHVVLVADLKGKIVGVTKADLNDRKFYEPRKQGSIIEFYILPEFRRKKLGDELLQQTIHKLKQKGAQVVTAEFPSHNLIATSFYEKRGFRKLICVYASEFTT